MKKMYSVIIIYMLTMSCHLTPSRFWVGTRLSVWSVPVSAWCSAFLPQALRFPQRGRAILIIDGWICLHRPTSTAYSFFTPHRAVSSTFLDMQSIKATLPSWFRQISCVSRLIIQYPFAKWRLEQWQRSFDEWPLAVGFIPLCPSAFEFSNFSESGCGELAARKAPAWLHPRYRTV